MLQVRSATCAAGAVVLIVAVASTAFAQAVVRGRITDKWDNPIPQVNVQAEPIDDGQRVDQPQETTTDDNGQYVLAGLFASQYVITFRAAGYQAIRFRVRPNTSLGANTSSVNRQDFELEALPPGGRLRGSQDFEAEGGIPKFEFDEDGTFEFEDAEGEGEGTYGVVEQFAYLTVRDYDGPDDKYTITEPITITFSSDQFTSFDWNGTTVNKR